MQKTQFKKVAIDAALKAGSYIIKKVGKVKNVRYKGDINIVTEVDKKAESIVVNTIKDKFPCHNIIAEEGSYEKRSCSSRASEFSWFIDPLDGTTNFLHGFPVFCVSIALAYKNRIILGVVYDPTRPELFYAEEAKGAYLNKKRIHVSKIRNIKKAMLATGFAYNVRQARNNNINNFIRVVKSVQALRRAGSAAIDLCYVACGRFDGFWELCLHPWDTAAGLLIAEEAGGKVTKMDGSKYNIYDKDILASNSKIHSQLQRILQKP